MCDLCGSDVICNAVDESGFLEQTAGNVLMVRAEPLSSVYISIRPSNFVSISSTCGTHKLRALVHNVQYVSEVVF